jgi:hypothetical protein
MQHGHHLTIWRESARTDNLAAGTKHRCGQRLTAVGDLS